jgi:hypothetical protein
MIVSPDIEEAYTHGQSDLASLDTELDNWTSVSQQEELQQQDQKDQQVQQYPLNSPANRTPSSSGSGANTPTVSSARSVPPLTPRSSLLAEFAVDDEVDSQTAILLFNMLPHASSGENADASASGVQRTILDTAKGLSLVKFCL